MMALQLSKCNMSKFLLAFSFWLALGGCASAPPLPPSASSRLDHLSINVADAKVAAEFYKGAFGFPEIRTPFAAGGGVVWLDLGNGTSLHIFGGRRSAVVNERERHIAFTVADMSKIIAFLVSNGIAWQNFNGTVGEVQTRPDGVRQMFFRDPDGYWIEVNDALKNDVR